MSARTIALCACVLLTAAQPLDGQELARYRDYRLGSDLLAVATQSGVAASEAKTIHLRPSVIQELEWRPLYFLVSIPRTDPVQQVTFSFYDDQLFRVTVDYDRGRTEGLTDADMIAAVSATYGPPLTPAPTRPRAARTFIDEDADTPIARWGDAEYSVTLLRRSYLATLRLVVASTRLDGLARAAAADAVRMDEREAPQREVARQQKEDDEKRVAREKARLVNKAVFKP